jgi:ADP-ribose pyrophosphatase
VEFSGWETLEREVHYRSDHLMVATENVRTPTRPNGRRWTIAHRKAAVVIAAITAAGELVLIREERVPIRSAIWGVPAGQIDDGDTSAAALREVAARELQEETGYELSAGGELELLGSFYSSVELSSSGHAHEESESILDCRTFPPEELARMIAAGEIVDANTLSICAKLVARGELVLHV